MFWHGALGFTVSVLCVTIEAWISEDSGMRILNYSGYVYMLMAISTILNTVGVTSMTIAFQSDSSGFVSLISYVSIFYSFIFDRIVFREEFYWVYFMAAVVILTVTVSTSVYKLRLKS